MVLTQFDLTGKVALVTGAARGLGASMAMGLTEAGAEVALLDRLPVEESAAALSALGRRPLGLQFDLLGLTIESASEIVAKCVAHFGRFDILVNNAGIIRRSSALDVSAEDWTDVLDINLTSAFRLCQAAARHFTSAGKAGKIINIASLLSFQGGVLVPAYAAAKSGLAGMTRALANEWAPLGINVNAIAPGYFETEVTSGIREDPARESAILSRIPAGRWGRPDDLMGAVVFLASDASDYVHGTVLAVDGGWLAR